MRAERSVTLKTTAPSEPQQRENRAHRNQGRGFGDRGNSVRHRFGHDDFESFVISVPPVADPAQIESRQDSDSAILQLCVEDALGQLPLQLRTMVELRIQGHEVAEIARQTGRSKRTIERNLQDVRVRFRQLLGACE